VQFWEQTWPPTWGILAISPGHYKVPSAVADVLQGFQSAYNSTNFQEISPFNVESPPMAAEPDFPEKTRIDYEHKLNIKELFIDKFVFAGFIAMLGGLAWLCANRHLDHARFEDNVQLESFKLKESEKRFRLEKRLEGLLEINKAASDAEGEFFEYVDATKKPNVEEVATRYAEAISRFRTAINRYALVLGMDIDKAISPYIDIHRALRDMDPQGWVEYRDFVAYLTRRLDLVYHAAYDEPQHVSVIAVLPVRMTYEERRAKGLAYHLHTQFAAWQALTKEQKQ
jgi:hypothetical protein